MSPTLVPKLLAALALACAAPRPADAAPQPGSPPAPDLAALEVAARKYAEPRVFAVHAGKGSGTAVLVKKENGFGYFATCYHVLYQSTGFTLYQSGWGGPLVADQNGTQVLARRSRDLVLLKVKLPAGRQFEALNPLDPQTMATENDTDPFPGFVFGRAGVMKRQLFTSGVRIQQKVYADEIPNVLAGSRQRDEPQLQLRLLGKEMTYAGMSGGLVVDANTRFAGLLLGRLPEPNAIPVMIPAAHVKELLDESATAAWEPYAAGAFQAAPPYDAKVLQRMLVPWRVSEIAWDSYEAWVRAFDADPLRFVEVFQEVRLDLNGLRSYARDEAAEKSGELRVRLAGAGGVQLLLNGVEWKLDRPMDLQPGENLLIVTRPPAAPAGGLDVTDLLVQNPIDLTLLLGPKQEPVFELKRSLPRVIQGYSIYVTIDNGPPGAGAGPAARLAVPLDYLEQVLNETPFKLPFGDLDRRSGSEFSGVAKPIGDRPVRLCYVSPQTLDVSAHFGIDVTAARANFAGLRLTGRPRSSAVRMTGRVQFPASPQSLLFVCARAMAAAGDEKQGHEKQFVLPLFGDELTVDASGLARMLLVSYANRRLLRPGNPRTPGAHDVREFLERGGLASADKSWRLDPTGVRLVRDDRPKSDKAWAVVTFRLLHDGKPVVVQNPPPLLPSADTRDGLAAEFVAAALPPGGLAALHPSVVGPTGLPRGLAAGAEVGAFDLRLAVARPKPQVRAPITLSENAVELVDQLGKAVAAGVAGTEVTGEVSWGGLKADGLDLEQIRLSVTYAPGAAAVPPQVVGKVAVGKAGVKTDRAAFALSDLRGTFTLTVDPKNDDRAHHFRISTTAGKYDSGEEKNTPLPKFDFDVWISRDGKRVRHNFGSSFLFGRGE